VGASGALTLGLAVHRAAGTFHRCVSRYLALTEFSRRLLIRDGFPADRIVVKPNSVPDPGFTPQARTDERRLVFAGRLIGIKGVRTLLDAWPKVPAGMKLVIAGDGELRSLVEDRAREVVGRLGRMPNAPVVVGITDRGDPEALLGLVQAGLGGYLLAHREAAGLAEAIRACTAGIFVIDAEIMSELAHDSPLYRYVPAPEEVERARLLSQREIEVLSRIARGKTTAQVAQELYISPKTVRNHLSHVMQKLGVRDRTQAVLFALRVGLIRRQDLLG